MQVRYRSSFIHGLAHCAGALLTALVLTACGNQEQLGDDSLHQRHSSESEIRYVRSADEFESGVAQVKATRPFRSFGLQITADPASVLEYQVLTVDGTWSGWRPVKIDENNGRYRGGHQVLFEPATEVRIRASVPAEFLRFELFPGTVELHDDDEWGYTHDGLGELGQWIARPGIWTPSAETLRIGDTMYLPYESADYCYGSLRTGTKELGDFILSHFPGTTSYGGYACRDIVGQPGVLSVHATGRALDVFVPVDGDSSCDTCADNDKGDPLAKWLLENAEYIGFSFVIWDRADWGAHRSSGSKWGSYGGSHPHHDHLHIEITSKAAAKQTEWFLDGKPWNPGTKNSTYVSPQRVNKLSDNRLRAFVWSGTSDGLSYITQVAVGSTDFHTWQSAGGTLGSNPVTARNANGEQIVFARNGVGELVYWKSTTGWTNLGGHMIGNPAVGMNADGTLSVFVHSATTGGLAWKRQSAPNGSFGIWQHEGGNILDSPAVGRNVDGTLQVFVHSATTDGIAYKRQVEPNGAFGIWHGVDGNIIGSPAVAPQSDGALYVFVHSETTGGLAWIAQAAPNSNLGIWHHEGGSIVGSPAVGRSQNGTLTVFVKSASDGGLAWKAQPSPNSEFGIWHHEGGNIKDDPSAVLDGEGKLWVFVHSATNDGLSFKVQLAPNGYDYGIWHSLGGHLKSF